MTNGIVARPVRREETWTAVRVAPRKAFRGHAFEIWLAFWHWVIRDRNPGQEHRLNFRFKLRFVMRVVPFSLLPFLPLIIYPSLLHFCPLLWRQCTYRPGIVASIRVRQRFLMDLLECSLRASQLIVSWLCAVANNRFAFFRYTETASWGRSRKWSIVVFAR